MESDEVWVLVEDMQRILGVVDAPEKAFAHTHLEKARWKDHQNGNYTWVSADALRTYALIRYEVNTFYPFDPKHLHV